MDRVGERGYLVSKKQKRVAHLWNGSDTSCRMATTGGLLLSKYHVVTVIPSNENICYMCKVNAAKKGN